MKAFLVGLTLIFFSSEAKALGPDCIEQAKQYGDGKGHSSIDQNCIASALANASSDTRVILSSSVEIMGYKNFIVKTTKKSQGPLMDGALAFSDPRMMNTYEFIAGSSTELENIVNLKYDKDNKEITVVDGHTGDTLIFSSELMGNVAPKRINKP